MINAIKLIKINKHVKESMNDAKDNFERRI
jgi:hypothetical protein